MEVEEKIEGEEEVEEKPEERVEEKPEEKPAEEPESSKEINFKKLREENERLRKKSESNVDIETIREEAQRAAKAEFLSTQVNEFLSQYDAESKELVKHYYAKLTAGEDVTPQNIATFMKQAESAASVNAQNPIQKIYNSSYGQGPKPMPENTDNIDKEKTETMAKMMGLQHINKEDKKD